MQRRSLRIVTLVIAAALFWVVREWPLDAESFQSLQSQPSATPTEAGAPSNAALLDAIRSRRSGVMVDMVGPVVHLLPDDTRGSRHQRFLVDVEAERAVLVSHNIDLAPRIDSLSKGDDVTVRGQFEWNEKGGVVHWTHDDPDARHPGGWIRHQGRTYR